MRRSFDLLLAVGAGIVLTFLVLPLVALFLRTSPGSLIDGMTSEVAVNALIVSLKTSAIAHVLVLGLGTPAAYLLARKTFPGRSLAVALVELPLVVPPAVAGIALLAAFGQRGLLGGSFDALGWSIPYTQLAVVLAVAFVASPFYIRQAIASFEALDSEIVDAARTLGASPWKTFRRVALPLAASGLGAGATLSFARGLGEFGATIMFAGSTPGSTQTMPLAIYAHLGRDFDVAVAIGAFLVLVAGVILVSVKVLPSWKPSDWTSGFRFARSS